jgi:hypothetical protein
MATSCSADCSALSGRQLETLAVAIGLVASMNVADADRPLLLERIFRFVARQG